MSTAYDSMNLGVGYLDGLTLTCNVVGPAYIFDPAHNDTADLGTIVATEDAVADVTVSGAVVVRIPSDQVEIDLGGETSIGGFVWSDPDDVLICWAAAEPGVPADPLTVSYPGGLLVVNQDA